MNTCAGLKLMRSHPPHHVLVFLNRRTLQPWNWNHFIYTTFNPTGRSYARNLKVLHDFTKNVIAERRARRSAGAAESEAATDDAGQKKKQPFLDMLLDARDDEGQPLREAGNTEGASAKPRAGRGASAKPRAGRGASATKGWAGRKRNQRRGGAQA